MIYADGMNRDSVTLRYEGGTVAAEVLVAIPDDTIRVRFERPETTFVPAPGMQVMLVADDGEFLVEILEVASNPESGSSVDFVARVIR